MSIEGEFQKFKIKKSIWYLFVLVVFRVYLSGKILFFKFYLLFERFIYFIYFYFIEASNKDAKRLYDDLFRGYNRLIRPVGNNTEKLTVYMGLKLTQILDVVKISNLLKKL